MNDKKMMWLWIGIGVIVVAILAWVIWGYGSGNGQPAINNSTSTASVSSGPAPVFAPKGQLTPGFPKQLILGSAAAVSGSYTINYTSSTNQYSTQFNSSSSMATLYAAYKKFLPANGWNITRDISTYKTFRGLNATNATSGVSVNIMAEGKGSQVIINFVVQ